MIPFGHTYIVQISTSLVLAIYAVFLFFSHESWVKMAISLGLSVYWLGLSTYPFGPAREFWYYTSAIAILGLGLGVSKTQHYWDWKMLCLNIAVPILANIVFAILDVRVALFEDLDIKSITLLVGAALGVFWMKTLIKWLILLFRA